MLLVVCAINSACKLFPLALDRQRSQIAMLWCFCSYKFRDLPCTQFFLDHFPHFTDTLSNHQLYESAV